MTSDEIYIAGWDLIIKGVARWILSIRSWTKQSHLDILLIDKQRGSHGRCILLHVPCSLKIIQYANDITMQ
jgi:hypothetical protein